MDYKKIYLKGKEAYRLAMLGRDFYKKHEEEIKVISSQVKKFFNSIKKDWDHYWNNFDVIDTTNLIKDIDIDYNEVVEWIADKHVVTTKEVGETFKVNPIEALLVLRQLENNHLVVKEINKTGSFLVLSKDMGA